MFSSLEAVPCSPEMSGWGCCVGSECKKLLYSPASPGNSLACCGNWRSWRSKQHLLRWKMRRKSTKKKIYWYASLHSTKEQRLFLHRWVTSNNDLNGGEIWPITVCPPLKFHILDLRHVGCFCALNSQGFELAQGYLHKLLETFFCLVMDQTHYLSVTMQEKGCVFEKKYFSMQRCSN